MAAPTNAVVVITRVAYKANQQQTLQNLPNLSSNMPIDVEIAALQRQLKGMALAIPKFDGQEDFDEWLIDFELLADELGKTTDADKANIPFQLAGDARLKYKTLSLEEGKSFQAIKSLTSQNSSKVHQNTLGIKICHLSSVALVDTGATLSIISENLLQKLNPQHVRYMKPTISVVYGVGSQQHEINTKIETNFFIDEKQYPVILGLDFVVAHGAQINLDEYVW